MDTSGQIDALKELLQHSSCYYVHCLDNEGNYTYVNDRFSAAFQFISSDLIGLPYEATMHADDFKVCLEVGKLCYQHPGKLFPAVIRKMDGAGGYIVTQWELTLIVAQGKPQGIFSLGYDITEYAQVKKEIKSINTALATKNEQLDAIAFEQSHVVRGPLANIMGLVSVLKTYELSNSAAAIVNMIEESSKQLDEAVRSIVNRANE